MGAAFDTSGRVRRGVITPRGTFSFRPGFVRWPDLSPFTQGYVEALFAAQIEWGAQRWSGPLGEFRGFSDLAPETLARINAISSLAVDLGAANTIEMGARHWAIEQANGVDPFPRQTPYLGDDGNVYLKAHPPEGHSHEG